MGPMNSTKKCNGTHKYSKNKLNSKISWLFKFWAKHTLKHLIWAFGLNCICLGNFLEVLRSQHFCDTFTTNPRWAIFTSSNLNLPHKSLFCLPITTSNNLLLKSYLWNYCKSVVKIVLFEILWFNLPRTKIWERSNFILNGLKFLFRVFKFI